MNDPIRRPSHLQYLRHPAGSLLARPEAAPAGARPMSLSALRPEACPAADGLSITIQDGVTVGFAKILALRAVAYDRAEAGLADDIDGHSFHVVGATRTGEVVAAMRVTCRRDGPLESESAYPPWLINDFAGALGACSRLCCDPRYDRGGRLPLRLMEHAWREGLRRGVRVAASKVRRRAIPYYLRLGSYYVRGSLFAFGRWQVECGLVAMGASPRVGGELASLFQEIPDPVDLLSHRPDALTNDIREVRRAVGAA